MGLSVETLRRFVAGGLNAQRAINSAIRERAHPHPRHVSDIDRDILSALPVTTAATYRYGDAWDGMMARSRLRTCGSIRESVRLEIAAEQLRERAGR